MKTIFPKLDPDTIKWLLEFGIPKKKITTLQLIAQNFNELPAPVFFLSTGRCGTKWFSDLLKKDRSLKIEHNPVPNLFYQGKKVFDIYQDGEYGKYTDLIEQIFLAARGEYLRYSYKTGRRLVETNNGITFFAPVIAKILPNAKFVHLHRHPGEFIRSGLRRKYYSGSIEDLRRLAPIEKHPDKKSWDSYSPLEKTAWLWRETNLFIENFKKAEGSGRTFSISLNELNTENVSGLLEFAGLNGINDKYILKMLRHKANIQKTGTMPEYQLWEDKDKEAMKKICGDLATSYVYNI